MNRSAGATALLSVLCLLPMLSCKQGGALIYKVAGPPAIQPGFVPGPATGIVLAENFRSPSAASVDADRLAALVTAELRRNRVFQNPDAADRGGKGDGEGEDSSADGQPADGQPVDGQPVDGQPVDGQPVDGQPVDGPTNKSGKPIGRLLDPGEVASLRTREPAAFPSMDVAEVGRRVGAGQVLYIDLQSAGADAAAGGNFYAGYASASVKWIDAESGETLWPTDVAGGAPVSADTPVRNPRASGKTPGATADSVRGEALRRLARAIGRLFYPYKPDEVEGPLDDEF